METDGFLLIILGYFLCIVLISVDTEVYRKILSSKKEYWAGDGMQSKCWPGSNHSRGRATREDYIDAEINKSCNGM